MKKKVAIFMTAVLLLSFLFPFQAMAGYDSELEKAITKAKSLLNISANYDNFTYNIYKQNDKTVYNLRWSDSKERYGETNISIDSNGKVQSYYSYKPYIGRDRQKLPKVSKSDALRIANAFIKKVNPQDIEKITLVEDERPVNITDGGYHFQYNRTEKGVPFPVNTVNVSVDSMTGEVQNYYLNWFEGIEFPDSAGVISAEKARAEFESKLGLVLAYKLRFDSKETKPYLVYTAVYNNQFIDAKTGEVITGDNYYGLYQEKFAASMGPRYASSDSKPVSLTPQEQEAVRNASDLLTEAKIEELARKALAIGSDFKVANVSLYNDWQNKEDYIWSVDFRKEENGIFYSVSASLDARSGEVTSFNQFGPHETKDKPKYNQEQCQAIAEQLLKEMQPEKSKEVVLNNWSTPVIEPMEVSELPRQYYFNFTRKVNGAFFPDNGINVTVDAVTGKAIGYYLTWYKKELPQPEKILTADEAYKIFFRDIGIQLQYIAQYSQETADRKILPIPEAQRKPDIKLVYAVKQSQPPNIDATTGTILGYDGRPYSSGKVVNYSDLKGSFAENQIKVLAEYGIALPGDKLMPNAKINQKEFLYLILKATNPYLQINVGDAKDEDILYSNLINSGIVKEGEKAPKALISRQEAVKYIIRAMSYDKAAEIKKDIYKIPFKDSGKISRELYGYVALAYGLNIVGGNQGYFNPSQQLTRAQAFVMLYNYLNAN